MVSSPQGSYSGIDMFSTPGSTSGGNLSAYGYIAGQVLQIGSQIYGGILQRRIYDANAMLYEAQGKYTSSVAEYNKAVARANALAIETVAEFDIERQKKAAERFRGRQVAGYAKAGVKLEGSPMEVIIDSATQAKIDQAITQYNARIGILQTESQIEQYDITNRLAQTQTETQAALSRIEGRTRQTQAVISGTSNLLSSSIDFYRTRR